MSKKSNITKTLNMIGLLKQFNKSDLEIAHSLKISPAMVRRLDSQRKQILKRRKAA